MNYPKNFGLIVEPPEPERYQLLGGALNTEVLLEDGDWSSYLPPFEPQASPYFDVAACTIYAFCGAIETLAKKKGYDIGDFSERFLAIVSDNQPPYGNTPGKVAQTAHSIGLIQNSALPWNPSFTSIDQYYQPKPMTSDLIKLANQFLKKWKIGYGDVGSDKASIQEALRHSPLTAGVCAWYPDGNGNFRFPDGVNYNHDVLLYKLDDFYRIFDSYEQDHKAIVPEAKLGFVMGYTLEPNNDVELTLIQKIVNILRQIIGLQAIIVERKMTPPDNLPILPTAPEEAVTIQKYFWDTPENARHSLRVICDEEGLSVAQKNELCAVMQVESGFNPRAEHNNKNEHGAIWSTDWGICQINDYYNIGGGKPFPSVQYVLENPDACIRWACTMWKRGKMNLWSAYKNKSYLKVGSLPKSFT